MNRRRRAFSLIETVVVVGLSGIVLTTGVSLIHMLMNVERTTQKSAELGISAARLSRLFRQDVHATANVESGSSDHAAVDRLRLELPSQRAVTYQVQSNRMARLVSVAGKPHHQDSFVFPAGSHISLRVSGNADRASVSVREPGPKKAAPASSHGQPDRGMVLRVEATVGRDFQYAPQPGIQP